MEDSRDVVGMNEREGSKFNVDADKIFILNIIISDLIFINGHKVE